MPTEYTETCLWVDLTEKSIRREELDPKTIRRFVGGYGLGASLIYHHMRPNANPLGAENILAFAIGPLTGSPTPTGTRWTVMGKSPLTNTWGDANGSGFFGAAMRRAGLGAVFFLGASDEPVFLQVSESAAEIRSAEAVWGLDCYETEDWVKKHLGVEYEAACIGPSGESLALISAVIHSKGRAAARSGLGAVMGSKRLKMLAVQGTLEPQLAQPDRCHTLRAKYVRQMREEKGFAEIYRTTGTPGYTPLGIECGDAPTQNWRASVVAFPNAESLSFEELLKYRARRSACWQCPVACWGTVRAPFGEETVEAHQPEYETAAAFGSLLLNEDYPSIIKANEICNRYGLDTISAGGCVAFALECMEHGILAAEELGATRPQWGDPRSIVGLLEMIAQRRGIGDSLADGVRSAAQELGERAKPFAIHVAGQELPMHDTRFEPAMAGIYLADATPGRHTQAAQYLVPSGFESERPAFGMDPERQEGRGHWIKEAACLCHTLNASGACLFGYLSTHVEFIPEFLSAVTGWDFDVGEMLEVGERIASVRQAFNVREGFNLLTEKLPARVLGEPPLPDGPTANIRVEAQGMVQEFLEDMGWTTDRAIPTKSVLERLDLGSIAQDLWPEGEVESGRG